MCPTTRKPRGSRQAVGESPRQCLADAVFPATQRKQQSVSKLSYLLSWTMHTYTFTEFHSNLMISYNIKLAGHRNMELNTEADVLFFIV